MIQSFFYSLVFLSYSSKNKYIFDSKENADFHLKLLSDRLIVVVNKGVVVFSFLLVVVSNGTPAHCSQCSDHKEYCQTNYQSQVVVLKQVPGSVN